MKRIALVLAAAMMFATAAPAMAVEVKVKGTWDFAFGVIDNRAFEKIANRSDGRTGQVRDDDLFEARQRVRTQVNFIASEYLQGVLMFEIGDIDWGRDKGKEGRGSGGGIDADGVNIETRLAYLDWMIPNTDVSIRMGLQRVTMPSTRLGSIFFDTDVAGVVVNSPLTDWLGLTAFWARPFDQYRNSDLSDEVDVFAMILPVTCESFSFSPYFMYGFMGANSGVYDYIWGDYSYDNTVTNKDRAKVWWAGANLNVNITDQLVLGVDGVYGHQQRVDLGSFRGVSDTTIGTSGWYIAATLDYTMDWGTPGIFGWYASGDSSDDDKDGKYGRLPVLGVDGAFLATTFGTGGYYAIGNGGNAALVSSTGTGTWGVGIQVADVSFIEDLSHTLRFAYYRGTNDTDMVERGGEYRKYAADPFYLTKDDSVFEVNFDHTYKIYDNLTAIVELGYLHFRSDKDTWNSNNMDLKNGDDAWKAELSFRYAF